MNKLKIFLTTFAICIMSVGFAFADSADFSDYEYYAVLNNGNDYLYFNTYVYEGGPTNKVVYPSSLFVEDGVVIRIDDFYTEGNVVSTNCFSLSQQLNVKYEDGGGVIPPQISPTIQEAIQGIVPIFSKQLSRFLPMALIMFSLVLSVPLVPRVIRLFF